MIDPQTAGLLRQLGYDPAIIEAAVSALFYLTIATIVAAIPTGLIAKRKRRSVTGWVMFALSLPLLPLVIVALLPAKADKGGQSDKP